MPDDAPTSMDAVINAYKAGIDRTLLRENLKRTVEERFIRLMELQAFAEELQRAGREARRKKPRPGWETCSRRHGWNKGLNFTLTTSIGDVDLLGEIAGGGGYDALLPHTVELSAFGHACRCIDLEMLIRVKRAAGRPKDLEAIAELESLRDER